MTCEVIFMKHTSQKHLKSQYLAYANITRALFTYKNTFLIMSSQSFLCLLPILCNSSISSYYLNKEVISLTQKKKTYFIFKM